MNSTLPCRFTSNPIQISCIAIFLGNGKAIFKTSFLNAIQQPKYEFRIQFLRKPFFELCRWKNYLCKTLKSASTILQSDTTKSNVSRYSLITSNLLGSDVSNIDILAKDSEPQIISSMCTVFAESEIVSLLAQDVSKESVAAGILQSIANRSASMLSRIDIVDEVAFTGGVAKSKVLVNMLEKVINKKIYISEDSQIIGALGAAIIGYK